MRRREDREDKTYYRSERVFAMNGQWYFGAREGDCGPFRTQEIARAALARFINEKVELASFQKSRELKILANNRLDDAFAASPAVVGNELFLRGRSNLYCIVGND